MTNLAHNIDDYTWLPPVPPRNFKLLPGEKAVLRAKPDETVSQWAGGERYVHISPLPGPWDNEVTPHLVGIMDMFSQESIHEIFLAGGSQGGKTDVIHNCWGWAAVHEPGPALITMQDRDTGTETVNDRLIPMVRDTPSLRSLKSKNPDDLATKRIRLKNGMVTYLAWSNSEGRLASKPIRYLIMDEVDLYPETAIKKGRARTRAFRHERKILEASTTSTETGRIWQACKLAQAAYDFHAVCPFCGEAQALQFAGLRWPDGIVDPADLDKDSVRYECSHCHELWDDEDRDEAVRRGAALHDPPQVFHGWRLRGDRPTHPRPSSAWFHVPPLLSRFVAFHEIVTAYLVTLLEPTTSNLVYFYNDCLGLPTPEDNEGERLKEKDLYQRRETWIPEGATWQVPMAACLVTADADVQANRIEVEVVAWGPGHESWGLEYKVFHGDPFKDDVWDALHEWAQKTRYRHESGAELWIVRLGIDIGYAAKEVSKFVKRDRRRYLAHKGSNTPGEPLVPHRPTKGKYGIPVYVLGTEGGKDTLFAWLTAEVGPRYCHFPMTYDFEYFRMLCSEAPKRKKDSRGRTVIVWEKRPGYVRNEALDVRVGNIAIREILNPNYEKLGKSLQMATEATDQKPAQEKSEPVKSQPRKIRRSGGFVKGWKS